MWFLFARIVVRVVILVLQAVGFPLSVSNSTMAQAVIKTEKAIRRSPAFQKAAQLFIRAWRQAGDSNVEKATAIFNLLSATHSEKFLLTIIQCLCSSMTWLEWAQFFGTVVCMILANCGTAGLALIAKIALVVNSASELAADINEVLKSL